jgi:hypothetical protein
MVIGTLILTLKYSNDLKIIPNATYFFELIDILSIVEKILLTLLHFDITCVDFASCQKKGHFVGML